MRPIIFAALGLSALAVPSMWLASGCAAGNDTGGISQGVTGAGGDGTSSTSAAHSGAGGLGGNGGAGGLGGASTVTGSSGSLASTTGSGGNGGTGGVACVPTDELCDGIDNNCDGKVDEGINLQTDAANCGSCGVKCALLFPHAEGTCQAGKCTFSSCKTGFVDANGTAADGCEYACVKKNGGVESCNDLDDDCNGSIDDGPSEVGLPCGEAKGACASGYQVCRNGGVECVGGKLPSAEVCDAPSGSAVASFDNDCNGKTDAEEGCVYPAGSEIRLDGGAKGADNSFQLAAAAAGGDFLAAFADDRNATKNGKVCSGGIIVDTKPSAAVDRTGNIDIFVKSSVDGGATWGSEAKVGGDLDATGNVPCGAGSIPKAEAFLASTLEPSVFLKQGRGYVAFTYFAEDQGRVRRIYVASANSPYTSWSPAKRIDAAGTNKTIDLFGPQGVLAKAGGSDTIAVIWSAISGSATDPQRDVFLASSGDGGGSFQAPVRVNTTAGNAELPVVATDGNGKVFVAWRATNDKRAVVRMVDVSSGTPALGAEQTLQPGGASTETVVVAADGQGNAHVAWLDLRSGGDGKTIRVSTSTDGGGSWPADGVLANPDGAYADAGAPTLAAVDGRAALAWEDTRSGAPDIYVNRWRSTTKTWGASSARADGDAAPGATASRAPSIALGPNGLTYVAWQDSRTGSNPGIFANVSLDGGASFPASATFPARLDQSGANDTQDVRMLSASGAPQAAAVWIRAVGTKGDVYARPLAP